MPQGWALSRLVGIWHYYRVREEEAGKRKEGVELSAWVMRIGRPLSMVSDHRTKGTGFSGWVCGSSNKI